MNEQELIEQYLPLVSNIVNKFKARLPKNFDIDDLHSEGVIALMAAVHKFDTSKENTFTGYAILRIRGAIQDELRRIDICSRQGRKKNNTIKKAIREIEQNTKKEATEDEIRNHLGLSKKEYYQWVQLAMPKKFQSIDEKHEDKEGKKEFSLENVLFDENNINSRDAYERAQLLEVINKKIAELPQKKRNILHMYYFQDIPAKEIGKKYGVCRTRITQINKETLAKIKQQIEKNK